MDTRRQITAIQAAIILISTIIGVGVLPLPLFAAQAASTGGPLVTALGGLVALFGLFVITKLGQRFPDKSIVRYSEELIGKWPARIGSVCIIVFFALLTALAAREFGEVVVTSVLKKTPLDVTVIVMLLLAAMSTRNSITVFAYIHHFYFPVLLFPSLLIIVLSLKNANALFLQPVWGEGMSGFVPGMLTIAALFQAAFVMTMVIPAMRNPARAMRASMWGLGIAGGVYVLIVTATMAVFGPEETKKLLWPTLELAKVTSLPANILERLDAAFLAIWVTAVFTTLFSTYYFTIHSISQLIRLKDHKMFSMMLLPYIFVMAMYPKNVLHMYEVIAKVGRIGLFLTIVYPLLLLIVSYARRKGGGSDERDSSTSKEAGGSSPMA
ncbi:GerAB/ArcD/ProY family transporter [Paenibacillus flagellatus]|uniref:Spore gernimation protein n=1 Tax=Paenibacillus flagellatus TaxID=2211139 RepID=A0A2V5KNM0_9BACL|nr:endospore germination permease [Paenibacillus flagellatus]PYI56880.1 spore gernimation protein [Paenibacillus flagellatus]